MDNGCRTIGIPPAVGGEAAQAAARGKARRKAAKVLGVLALAGVAFFARESRAGEFREPGETKTVALPGGATMEMVWCPPGTFAMGSPASEEGRDSDETQHQVTLSKGFWMAKYEVTQKQWKSVMGNNPSKWKGDDLPVENVSWNECVEFCRKAGNGLQLPTEAQWEYACRAGSTTEYFWGEALNGDRANCDGNYPYGTTTKGPYKAKTTRVGSYAPNAWGLYDMHGNVWEWCADWKGAYPTGAVTDPQGPDSGSYRVGRGGSWLDYARSCRSAFRIIISPGSRGDGLGFRPVSGEP